MACAAFCALPLRAVDVGTLSVHGSVSTTAAYSDRYSYLGDTKGNVDVVSTEIILNGSHRFDNGLRAAVQLYAYQLGGYNDLAIDFASLDYSFSEQIGVRIGRNKHAFGLSGDAQDVDVLHPFAFLPLDFYDKRLRPMNAAIDGLSVYGQLPLGSAGSIEYQLDGGWIPAFDLQAPFFQGSGGSSPFLYNSSQKNMPIYNAWAFWNTPVEGLRLGGTYLYIPEIGLAGTMKTSAMLSGVASDARLLPAMLPRGLWDAMIAGKPGGVDVELTGTYLSAEYTRGNWQFASEAQFQTVEATATMPLLGTRTTETSSASYYAMATWQAAPKWQFGTYYGLAYADTDDRHGRKKVAVPNHTAWLKDLAFAASHNLTDWWLVKAEAHLLNGTKGVVGANNIDAARWKADWTYFVLKTTVSF
jgi:hypothetical protein